MGLFDARLPNQSDHEKRSGAWISWILAPWKKEKPCWEEKKKAFVKHIQRKQCVWEKRGCVLFDVVDENMYKFFGREAPRRQDECVMGRETADSMNLEGNWRCRGSGCCDGKSVNSILIRETEGMIEFKGRRIQEKDQRTWHGLLPG